MKKSVKGLDPQARKRMGRLLEFELDPGGEETPEIKMTGGTFNFERSQASHRETTQKGEEEMQLLILKKFKILGRERGKISGGDKNHLHLVRQEE